MCLLPAVILAAGASRRMGRCKLVLPWQGDALVSHVIRAAQSAGLGPLIIVTRPDPDPVLRSILYAVSSTNIHIVEAAQADLGQAESLKAGVRHLLELEETGHEITGTAVLLGDQPLIGAPLIRHLIEIFLTRAACPTDRGRAVAPVCEGQRGHPVFLPRRGLERLLALKGDQGARSVLADFDLLAVPVRDKAILWDIDTREAYAYLLRRKERQS